MRTYRLPAFGGSSSLLVYYLRLALRSFARHPGITALMVTAIGLGIGVCVVTLTVYAAMAGNPVPEKSGRLYAVTMDSWDPQRAADERRPTLPPPQLTYRDATFLFGSDIPRLKVIMYPARSVVAGGRYAARPLRVRTRITSADFFAAFGAPFRYGRGWHAQADQGPEPVLVLSHDLNEELFGGANSVGRTIRWNDREFRVIGVLDEWLPMPKFYDLNGGAFDEPEDVYVPWGWGPELEIFSAGSTLCWGAKKLDTFADILGSECTWIQMWVELPTDEARIRMLGMMDAYWAEQRAAGRFQRPRNNRLTEVGEWLRVREAVPADTRILLAFSFAFLGVCLVNTVGLLLAKFHSAAAVSGVRRALGASRRHIFVQHLVEAGVLAGAGALLGLVFAALGLWAVRAAYSNAAFGQGGGYEALAQFSGASLGWAALLAVVATLVAGLYPAWRIGRLAPVVYLRSQ